MTIKLGGKEVVDILRVIIEQRYNVKVDDVNFLGYDKNGALERYTTGFTLAFETSTPTQTEVVKVAEDRKIDINL